MTITLFRKWWPMFTVVFYFLAPLPMMIAKNMNNGSSETSPEMELGMFLTSGFGMHIVTFSFFVEFGEKLDTIC